ncbi:MAG: SMC-Scp complex subunit ScpB [Steroidobacteraceae bacterium]
MSEQYFRNVIEAALLAAGRPVQPAELIQLFDESTRPAMEQLRAALEQLAAEYAERGIELKETASGVRIQVRRELAGEVSRLWPERPARYSRALLETLALIAYRQPMTRGEIEAVRGVAVNPNIVKTLLERNWVRVVGTRDVPGRPELLGTTRDFLDYFGLKTLDDLPPLSELKAVGDINLQLDLQGEASQPAPAPALDAAAAVGGAAESPAAPAAEESAADDAAMDDEEDGDESDELSAEGGDSHELVAAPRDNGD